MTDGSDRGPLEGKVVLVTGAARRLGAAISLDLASRGARVVVHYSGSESESTRLCEEIGELGSTAWPLQADFRDPAQARALVSRALRAAGRLDMLVNNASIFPADTLNTATFDTAVESFKVNAWAPFLLSREFATGVGHGKIVNLLDTRVVGGDHSHVSYILSKHCLAEMTRMCAAEFAPGITVNAVAPGLILPPEGKDEAYLEQLADSLPLKRHGHPGDVVRAVGFLLESDFITGQVIYVDGGRHIREGASG